VELVGEEEEEEALRAVLFWKMAVKWLVGRNYW